MFCDNIHIENCIVHIYLCRHGFSSSNHIRNPGEYCLDDKQYGFLPNDESDSHIIAIKNMINRCYEKCDFSDWKTLSSHNSHTKPEKEILKQKPMIPMIPLESLGSLAFEETIEFFEKKKAHEKSYVPIKLNDSSLTYRGVQESILLNNIFCSKNIFGLKNQKYVEFDKIYCSTVTRTALTCLFAFNNNEVVNVCPFINEFQNNDKWDYSSEPNIDSDLYNKKINIVKKISISNMIYQDRIDLILLIIIMCKILDSNHDKIINNIQDTYHMDYIKMKYHCDDKCYYIKYCNYKKNDVVKTYEKDIHRKYILTCLDNIIELCDFYYNNSFDNIHIEYDEFIMNKVYIKLKKLHNMYNNKKYYFPDFNFDLINKFEKYNNLNPNILLFFQKLIPHEINSIKKNKLNLFFMSHGGFISKLFNYLTCNNNIPKIININNTQVLKVTMMYTKKDNITEFYCLDKKIIYNPPNIKNDFLNFLAVNPILCVEFDDEM